MYVRPNFKTKKLLKEAVKAGQEVRVFSPGPFPCPQNGVVDIEGPHYPAAHTWGCDVLVENGLVKKIL